MLNSVACKSSSEGTFSTKRLIATIVACGVLRVKRDFEVVSVKVLLEGDIVLNSS